MLHYLILNVNGYCSFVLFVQDNPGQSGTEPVLKHSDSTASLSPPSSVSSDTRDHYNGSKTDDASSSSNIKSSSDKKEKKIAEKSQPTKQGTTDVVRLKCIELILGALTSQRKSCLLCQ